MPHTLFCTDSTDPPVFTSAAACRDGIISVTFIPLGILASGHCQTGVRHAHSMTLEQSVLSPASYTIHFGLCAKCFFCLFLLQDIHYPEFSFSWAIPYFLDETPFISLKFQRRLGVKCCLQKISSSAFSTQMSLSLWGKQPEFNFNLKNIYFSLCLLSFVFLLILLLTRLLGLAENLKSYSLRQPLGD